MVILKRLELKFFCHSLFHIIFMHTKTTSDHSSSSLMLKRIKYHHRFESLMNLPIFIHVGHKLIDLNRSLSSDYLTIKFIYLHKRVFTKLNLMSVPFYLLNFYEAIRYSWIIFLKYYTWPYLVLTLRSTNGPFTL